jgi:hypothetical protein
MKNFFLTLMFFFSVFVTPVALATFQFSYGLNYESDKDTAAAESSEYARTYHKIFLGASINGAKTLFLGQNINSWSRELKQGTNTTTAEYSLLELGPKLLWYLSEQRASYISLEWNPYVVGDRKIAGIQSEVRGDSLGIGFGYRFKLSKNFGIGGSLNYTKVNIKKETVSQTESDKADGLTMIVPMLEFAYLTK